MIAAIMVALWRIREAITMSIEIGLSSVRSSTPDAATGALRLRISRTG